MGVRVRVRVGMRVRARARAMVWVWVRGRVGGREHVVQLEALRGVASLHELHDANAALLFRLQRLENDAWRGGGEVGARWRRDGGRWRRDGDGVGVGGDVLCEM